MLCASPILEITPYFLSQFEELVPGAAGVPFGVCDLIDGKRPNKCYKLKRRLHVGEELRFEMKVQSTIAEDLVDVDGAVEPGIPIGMEFADPSSTPGRGTKTRTVSWKPRPGQQGKTHIAGFVGIIPEDDSGAYGGANCPLYLERLHIQIDVESYTTYWQPALLPADIFDKVLIGPRPLDIVSAGKAGTDLMFSVTPGQFIEGLELSCYSDVVLPYQPAMTLYNVTVDGEPASGNAGWGGFGEVSPLTPYSGGMLTTFEFRYVSGIGTDEGSEKRWCFACSDSGGMYPPAIQCITIRTRLCEVCRRVSFQESTFATTPLFNDAYARQNRTGFTRRGNATWCLTPFTYTTLHLTPAFTLTRECSCIRITATHWRDLRASIT